MAQKIKINTVGNKDNAVLLELWKQTMPDELEISQKDVTIAQLKSLYQSGIQDIEDAIIGVEVDSDTIESSVPETFPNSDGRDWGNYAIGCIPSGVDSFILIAGHKSVGSNNRPFATDATELKKWSQHFGIDNMLSFSEVQQKISTYQENNS